MAKQLREHGLMLEKKLKGLEDIINDDNVTALLEYKETKQAFEKLNEKKAQGIFVRSRARFIKEGGKCTNSFFIGK